jgi:IS30 family transposase
MRTMRKRDVYGSMQRWIMTVKDHSTGLVYLTALPKKKAEYVASELEKYFGFAGFPHILHTDNGKEFIATLVVDMMMRHNPDCFLVTGRPRTPRNQGSVENANKVVKQVLMSLS